MERTRRLRRAANMAAASRAANESPVHLRHLARGDEGVLYTHRIRERHSSQRAGLFRRRNPRDDQASVGSNGHRCASPLDTRLDERSRVRRGSFLSPTPQSATLRAPQSETLRAAPRAILGQYQKQYTIAPKKRYKSSILNWLDQRNMDFITCCFHRDGVDNNVYRPSTFIYRYIDWTFPASFTAVVTSFLLFYFTICVIFGLLLLAASRQYPECVVASGAPFGETPHTAFSDAVALSWTTFTTVGYGMTYTSTASDFGGTAPHQCSLVVFLCTTEAFGGLLFAGMCAAILFGKVNRVQSHANLIFCNAVCLQYEEADDYCQENNIDSERSQGLSTPVAPCPVPIPVLKDEENQLSVEKHKWPQSVRFVDQFNGCPILKFQVVNELCNIEGGELVDCMMKVIGIKFKGSHGKKITHSQYVRVNLLNSEHPFLSRAWHCVHVLDAISPLLTDRARQRIEDNGGSWPSHWFDDPEVIRNKLEFHDLIVTVAALSNRSAITVHAYKRYKIGDVLIGYYFAPIVFRNVEKETLEVDLSMCNDVREQYGIQGEDLVHRHLSGDNLVALGARSSNIRIKLSKSHDALSGSVHSEEHPKEIITPPVEIANRQEQSINDPRVTPISPLAMAECDASENELSPGGAMVEGNLNKV